MTYNVIAATFRGDFDTLGINLRLRELHTICRHSSEPLSDDGMQCYLAFLMSQSTWIREMTIGWFTNEAVTREDPCVGALNLMFTEFQALEKLVICDGIGYLTQASVDGVHIISNPNITELRLRVVNNSAFHSFFDKLAGACPNLKSLVLYDMDQQILDVCAQKLTNLEFIFAFSFCPHILPKADVKLPRLKRGLLWSLQNQHGPRCQRRAEHVAEGIAREERTRR